MSLPSLSLSLRPFLPTASISLKYIMLLSVGTVPMLFELRCRNGIGGPRALVFVFVFMFVCNGPGFELGGRVRV